MTRTNELTEQAQKLKYAQSMWQKRLDQYKTETQKIKLNTETKHRWFKEYLQKRQNSPIAYFRIADDDPEFKTWKESIQFYEDTLQFIKNDVLELDRLLDRSKSSSIKTSVRELLNLLRVRLLFSSANVSSFHEKVSELRENYFRITGGARDDSIFKDFNADPNLTEHNETIQKNLIRTMFASSTSSTPAPAASSSGFTGNFSFGSLGGSFLNPSSNPQSGFASSGGFMPVTSSFGPTAPSTSFGFGTSSTLSGFGNPTANPSGGFGSTIGSASGFNFGGTSAPGASSGFSFSSSAFGGVGFSFGTRT
eukprot:TRINITY_DN15032_c0_g1_i1.p1 TRINITY_DN15032_c0_g1~~TRINITY_DN15032_c0_g1_i1.p1  ORF type:complete len:308 (-),score=72.23 TRINITY_DN15032_c0_g1_i1:27-950(-)